MNNHFEKLTLPTVETCSWRIAPENGSQAECRLVKSLTGVGQPGLAVVSDEVCVACCKSFPPSPNSLNSVVAGVLYDAVCQIEENRDNLGLRADRIAALKDFAKTSIAPFQPASRRVTPAREVEPCTYLGERVNPEPRDSIPGEPDATFHKLAPNAPVHECEHPAHTLTTPAECRLCRDWSRDAPVSRPLSLAELVPPPSRRCGQPVRNWAVGVTTSPRRDPTLEACLDSLTRAGWTHPTLFLDGTVRIPSKYNHLRLSWREDSVGAWPAWYLAFAELVLFHPEADAYVMLQDDVSFYDRESLRSYLEDILWPGEHPGMLSLFYNGLETSPGWYRSESAWEWGAQCFIFPPDLARSLLTDTALSQTWLPSSPRKHVPIPNPLSEWAHRNGIDAWYPRPSVCQHIGNTSTIWSGAENVAGRKATWFAGSVEASFAQQDALADFPENLFPCLETRQQSYLEKVQTGLETMAAASVVLCGLCRDVRHFLPRTAARAERLGEMFHDYHVVLFENDSVDATREFLSDWQIQNPRVDVISEALGRTKHPRNRSRERAAWMAQCRNRLRERIIHHYPAAEYVIMVDTDLPGGWSYDGIAHSFGHRHWDCIGSYGVIRDPERPFRQFPFLHFDVWAFRPKQGTAARKLVDHNHLVARRGEDLLPVESCFGGLGVYRMECLRAAEYGGGDCEHVVFHHRLRDAGFDRIFMNPSQIVLYSPG